MTDGPPVDGPPVDGPPTNGKQFRRALAVLIQRAYGADVDVEGGWKCTIDGNGDHHWDVQITTVEYGDD